ncbi:hypothetical protein BFJ63_vAg18157 [Fusarium oxysporum f. sp. narcissi]|uniref:Uncharacterized protein n=1 Tax=Fusarium oxysporum f. sp. narcissi TaxID=451672 RepID=A0A4Q2UY25_FUSOX|nr:hypothetical protein BFJ63_vAg18157 [Fusarium oxysporum f. sp. narcissi]
MTTPPNEPTTDICQCTKAKEACESEGDPGTTVICPGCHLEEATAGERDEQAALPDEKRVYAAFKNSPSLMKIAAQEPGDQPIRLVIRKRQKGQQAFAKTARKLVKEYGTTPIVTSLKGMLDEGVFTSTDVAKRRFPDLFPEGQVLKPEEEQETETGHLSTKEIERLDGEYNQSSEAAGGFGGNYALPNVGNAESLPNLLSSVGRIQNVIIHRLNLNFEEVNQFLLNAEEFIRLLDTPLYLDAVKPLRQRIEEVLLMANRDAALIHNEADGKVSEIEAQRERLKREEEGIKRHRDENLDNIRSSIERDIFAAMGQAKDALPGIGLADNR